MRGAPKGVRIQGVDGLMVRYAQCCQPVPGDPVVGYVTRGRGVSIHRADCPNLLMLAHEPERRLEIDWQEQEGERFLVRLALEGNDRRGLYADVAAAVSATRAPTSARMELKSTDGKADGLAPRRGREPHPPAEDHQGGAQGEGDHRRRAPRADHPGRLSTAPLVPHRPTDAHYSIDPRGVQSPVSVLLLAITVSACASHGCDAQQRRRRRVSRASAVLRRRSARGRRGR